MALYRTISMTFWTDTKISDKFTPEDRYFYLYLFTNPHTNLAGCYEISIKQMSYEIGYSKDSIENLISRFETVHNVIRYNKDTTELLILNWHKYNWTSSEKFRKPLAKEIENIKCQSFKNYLTDIFNGGEGYGIDTKCINTSCIDTSVTDTNTINNIYINKKEKDINKNTNSINNKNILNNLTEEFNISSYLKDSIETWLSYKKERRFTYKDSGLRTLIKTIKSKADEYGEQAVAEVINESISSGYQGIMWDWMRRYKPQPKPSVYDEWRNA